MVDVSSGTKRVGRSKTWWRNSLRLLFVKRASLWRTACTKNPFRVDSGVSSWPWAWTDWMPIQLNPIPWAWTDWMPFLGLERIECSFNLIPFLRLQRIFFRGHFVSFSSSLFFNARFYRIFLFVSEANLNFRSKRFESHGDMVMTPFHHKIKNTKIRRIRFRLVSSGLSSQPNRRHSGCCSRAWWFGSIVYKGFAPVKLD